MLPGGTSVRLQLSWFLPAGIEATPAPSCELGRPGPALAARLLGHALMVICRHAGQWFVRHGTSPIVMTHNQVRVFFRSYRCRFAWFVRLASHHSQVAFLAFVVNESLSSFMLHVLRLSSTKVLMFAIVFRAL